MTTAEIISKFELYVDDATELSSTEELDLANKIYQKVCSYRPWEFLKKTATGTIVSGEITLPTDFAYVATNSQSTDPNVEQDTVTAPKVVFVGTDLAPYRIVNFSDRRQYKEQNVCYIDPSDSKIKFIVTPTQTSYEFDYIKVPSDLIVGTSPIFPARFHDIIVHGMASEDYIIQQFDKAKAYIQENAVKYSSILADMSYWNAMQNFN
jgi:hypothetical protein